MITIYNDDLPIEVAAKLITSVDVRIFDKQELKAIAEHLLIYVNEDEE